MQLYRSILASGGGDFSPTYTDSINGVLQEGTCNNMFQGNTSFNSSVTIGDNVNSTSWMFSGCSNMGSNVYFKGTSNHAINVNGMFRACNNSIRKNIYFNSSLNHQFNRTTATTSLVGNTITWTTMTNGFYNSVYNIYCYNNYSG